VYARLPESLRTLKRPLTHYRALTALTEAFAYGLPMDLPMLFATSVNAYLSNRNRRKDGGNQLGGHGKVTPSLTAGRVILKGPNSCNASNYLGPAL
jgi:hypothetical protein